jgi:superfamily II DNA or RNA helicase
MISLRIGSHLELSGLPLQLERQFIRDNSFPNPKRETLERLGKWAGGEPETINLWARHADQLCLPRGYFPAVIVELKRAGLQFRIEDRTTCPPMRDHLEAKGNLYPFQESALVDLLRWPTGVLEAPTGCGKTNILLSAAARLGTPALVCVHTTELFNQTCDRVRSWLGVEPGVIAGSKAILRPITVAMIQTLARRDLQAEGIADYFGTILIDETHHSPAVTWANILQQMPARYKYGVTATAWRKDGLQFLMWRLLGSKSAKIDKAEAEAAGKIIWPDFETVETDYFYSLSDSSEWTAMLSDLIADRGRNALIESEVRSMLNDSRALILTDRIEHANILAGQLEDLNPVLLTGELSRSEREQAMLHVREGARLTIATIHLLGEGIDVPGWNLLFLVSPIAGGPRTLQAVGRVARPAPGKQRATVVDFIDNRIPALVNAARSRQRLYAS